MKKITMLILLTVLSLTSLTANTDEYLRQRAILNERAEKFKTETGFEGTISHSKSFRETGPMRFGNLFGNFRDIEVTAKKDTVIMRQVFEQVRTKIMPYVRAEEGQLFAEKVITDITMTRIMYYQKINGYPVYRAGRLVIDYNFSTSEFVITDNTREISSEYVPINITEDEAINIVLKHYGDEGKFDINNSVFRGMIFGGLEYDPILLDSGEKKDRLCYIIFHGGYTNYVDPSSGKIIHKEGIVIRNSYKE